ncbi:MAG: hypothetical protein J6J24_03745 [Clostridia bacterium]|nr:hypothetical protein [Clostridia bacterium]
MTVKEILKLVCEFVGEKELCAKLKSEQEGDFSDRELEKLDCMVDCFNLVRQEIASDYLPFLTKEEIDINNSILEFSRLSKVLINVYQIKSKFGISLRFKLFPNFVEICGKAKSIVYSYLPEDLSLNDEVEFENGLTARVYAYGIASEFLLVDGLSEDAEIWEERFKESLFVLSRKRSEHIMPRRSWR